METNGLIAACRAWLTSGAAVGLMLSAGGAILPRAWRRLPSPWPWALAALLGWHLAAALVFALGALGGLTGRGLLLGFWLPLLLLTLWGASRGGGRWLGDRVRSAWSASKSGGDERVLWVLMLAFAAVLAIVASAPPTKHDELLYHLMPARRGLIDAGFRFYATPNHQVPPHMVHQSLFVALLAAGGPAATGVFCLLWGWLAAAFVYARAARVSRPWAAACAAVVLVAFKNCVWWTAPNPESVAALWCAMLFVWLLDSADGSVRPRSSAAVVALLAAAAAMTKLPYLRVGAGAALLVLWRSRRSVRELVSAVGVMSLLVAVTYGPWLVRTYVWTCNPFGFAGMDIFGSRVFDPQRMADRLLHIREVTQRVPLGPLAPLLGLAAWARDTWVVKDLNLLHPLLALGLGLPALVRLRRWDLLGLMLFSYTTAAYWLPHDVRFHLFTVYGLLLAGVLHPPRPHLPASARRSWSAVLVVASLPTVAGAAYYSKAFWGVVVGAQPVEAFLSERTGLYDVYRWCNGHTPPGARFCIAGRHLARPFYLERIGMVPEGLTRAEQPRGRDFASRVLRYMRVHGLDYVVSTVPLPPRPGVVQVAAFPDTIVEAYRTPNRASLRGDVFVYRVER